MTDQNEAINLLNEQLAELEDVRKLNHRDAKFKGWQDMTLNLLSRFLQPNSSHLVRFRDIRYWSNRIVMRGFNDHRPLPPPNYVSPEDREAFNRGCELAEESIKGAIKEIRIFGVHTAIVQSPPPRNRGGVQQIFHGSVVIQSQAIATDSAIQSIGQIGATGEALKGLADLLRESMDLTGTQQVEGLKAIEVIASETQKQEPRRNWRSILDCGEKLLNVTQKAADITTKVAPYLPAIQTLIHEAGSKLKL
jgi:hypothetical protein